MVRSMAIAADNSNYALERLRQLIEAGEFANEGRLPTERALTDTLGVSRRAVRRALEVLEAEGLVWRRQGSGTFVGERPEGWSGNIEDIVAGTDFMEIMEVRLRIEPQLAQLAALRAKPADIARMRDLANKIMESSDADSRELWDGALHRQIAQSAGNKLFLSIFDVINRVRQDEAWQAIRERARALFAAPAMASELRIGLNDDADVLDPAQSRTFVGRIVYTAMCDKLVDIDKDMKVVPQLATEWAWAEGGKVLTMKLRQGVKFHDGTPLNAEAVVYTIQRNLTLPESRRKSELSSVEKVEATGDYEVKFTLKSPDVTLLAQLSDRAGVIVSPKAAKELGANFGSHPVCAGPFKFVERIQQDRIVLEKFADYWDKDKVLVDKVTYLPIPDTTVKLANLRAGDLDLAERISASDAESVKNDAALTYADVIGPGYMAMYVNLNNGPRADNPLGKDKRLRQAFSLAIDREAIGQIVFEGTSMAGNQPFPPSSPWFDKDIPVPARDVEKAKQLMKEAGYETLDVELQHANNTTQTQMMQVIQSMVAEAGFNVTLKATEFATLLSEQTAGNYQLSRSDWSGRIDPDGNLHQFVTCKGGINDVKYCNPEVDKLLNEARMSTDDTVRKQKYDAAAAILNDDMPIIYLGHQPYAYAVSKKVKGFAPSPDGMIRLLGVSKD
eukprot:g19972.t1